MNCRNCVYYYKNPDDDFMTCHCTESEGLAPCEQELNEIDEYDVDDFGDYFDYWDGCEDNI